MNLSRRFQNYRFKLGEWLPRFPLDLDATRYSGKSITGPAEICNNEMLRREMQDQYEWGPAVPVDIFVMAEGESENRQATNVGGLPQAKRIVSRKKQKYPQCLGKDVWSAYHLLQYQAMQIGTAPFFIQGNPELAGRLLCTVSSVQPDQHTPYPWINHPAPLLPEDEWSFDTENLRIVDSGCIYISIDDEQQLHWDMSSF